MSSPNQAHATTNNSVPGAHTQGELKVSDPVMSDGAQDYAIFVEIDGKTHIIAEVFGRSDWEHEHPSLANANLFAAAPDLLKVCRALYHAMLSYKLGNESPELADEVAAAAQAAIAKAEGKEAS